MKLFGLGSSLLLAVWCIWLRLALLSHMKISWHRDAMKLLVLSAVACGNKFRVVLLKCPLLEQLICLPKRIHNLQQFCPVAASMQQHAISLTSRILIHELLNGVRFVLLPMRIFWRFDTLNSSSFIFHFYWSCLRLKVENILRNNYA